MPFDTPLQARHSSKPTKREIDAQVDKLHDNPLFVGDKRWDLLRYLVRIQREGRYKKPFSSDTPKPTGKRILFEFYRDWGIDHGGVPLPGKLRESPGEDDTEPAGKKLIADLAEALDEYYKTATDRVVINILRGRRAEGYAPEISYRRESTASVPIARLESQEALPSSVEFPPHTLVECHYLGRDREAMRYVVERYRLPVMHSPKLLAVRDTHVRPLLRMGQRADYDQLEAAFAEFLARFDADVTVATLIVGWEVDKDFLKSVQAAATGHGDKLRCFRLRNPGPLMDFLLFDYDDSTSEVLFGWGEAKPGWPGGVFRSSDKRLVGEFSHHYEVLQQSSKRVSIHSLLEPPSRAKDQVVKALPMWSQTRFFDLLSRVERAHEHEEDLRMVTVAFSWSVPDLHLEDLLSRNVRIRIIMMNPANTQLLKARHGLRKDKTTWEKGRDQIQQELAEFKDLMVQFPHLQVKLSNAMPCGFVAHSKNWALAGLFLAQGSYVTGPMIEVRPDTDLWKKLYIDWQVRWTEAKFPSKT